MFCANCYKEIPIENAYFKHQNTNQCFCSLNCMNDWLIHSQAITIEISKSSDENQSKSEV